MAELLSSSHKGQGGGAISGGGRHGSTSSTSSAIDSSPSSGSGRSSDQLPPELLVQLSTENALQLTVTKSSLGLLKSLLESYTVPPGKVGGAENEEGVEEVDTPAPETFEPAYCITNMVRREKKCVL